jgi:hypothetical protein
MQQKKIFNSSGPNIPEKHYTLGRDLLMQEGKELVGDSRYISLFAPRQSGKSTFFQMLGAQLEQEGYKVCYTIFGGFTRANLQGFLNSLSNDIQQQWGETVNFTQLVDIKIFVEKLKNDKRILIIDEVDGINAEFLNDLLHIIRDLYHVRHNHSLKSVILVSVQNITGAIQSATSPFNINEELEVPYFTEAEILELLAMHETATGQLFSPKVKERICYMTAGQPGLVNGFAGSLVKLFPNVPVFEFEHYEEIEHNYTHAKINKNVSNIVEKAKLHRKFVEQLLFEEKARTYMIQEERIKDLTVNGVIGMDKQKNICFPVPLYRKCLHAAFAAPMNGEAEEIMGNLVVAEYFLPNKQLNIDKIIRDYQIYAKRRGFRYFMEKNSRGVMIGLKEAALVYSFETYIQSFLQVLEGKSYLEPHVALGRSDLIVNVGGSEFVIEAKIFYNATQIEKGKKQLAYYIESLNLTTGVYLIFADSRFNNPVLEEADEIIEGIHIRTYLVRYDVETDFSAPKKKK